MLDLPFSRIWASNECQFGVYFLIYSIVPKLLFISIHVRFESLKFLQTCPHYALEYEWDQFSCIFCLKSYLLSNILFLVLSVAILARWWGLTDVVEYIDVVNLTKLMIWFSEMTNIRKKIRKGCHLLLNTRVCNFHTRISLSIKLTWEAHVLMGFCWHHYQWTLVCFCDFMTTEYKAPSETKSKCCRKNHG